MAYWTNIALDIAFILGCAGIGGAIIGFAVGTAAAAYQTAVHYLTD